MRSCSEPQNPQHHRVVGQLLKICFLSMGDDEDGFPYDDVLVARMSLYDTPRSVKNCKFLNVQFLTST